MGNSEAKPPEFKSLVAGRRQPVSVSQEGLVRVAQLLPETALPALVQPAVEDLSLVSWAGSNREQIELLLLRHGGILFRGFQVPTVAEFERLIAAVSGELLEYSYRSTPRHQVSGRIYTSTEYPADQTIPMHNEMAYTRSWPMKIWFFCVKKAEQGGETPVADSRKVFNRIDPRIRERFMHKGVMYMRNYGQGVDLSWQDVFQTNDKAVVEEFCRSAGIAFEWRSDNRLRTTQVCQAAANHPKTNQMVWFNQAHLFHISGLPPDTRKAMLSVFKEEDLPRNTYYGDGTPIEMPVLDEIRAIYEQEMIAFPWDEGDVLLLDNMLTAHGRAPYRGKRKIVVGMAEQVGAVA